MVKHGNNNIQKKRKSRTSLKTKENQKPGKANSKKKKNKQGKIKN